MTLPSRPAWLARRRDTHPLDPPPTPEEFAWWKDARPAIRRREVMQWGLLIGIPLALTATVKDGVRQVLSYAALGHAALAVGLVLFCGGFMWLILGREHMRLALTEKRLRDGLRREAEQDAVRAAGGG